MEERILETAREIFVKKGFEKTSMSDIAAAVGINRSGLHYYFRTKEKMFQAVVGSLVQSFIPRIHEVLLREGEFGEKLEEVVDIYYHVFKNNPHLPAFLLDEARRDIQHLKKITSRIHADQYMSEVKDTLLNMMEKGEIAEIPIPVLFLNFYGLITIPFLTKDIASMLLQEEGENFEQFIPTWKIHVVEQMRKLLKVT